MKGKNLRVTDTRPHMVTLRLDAPFFFERAVRSLDRNHYDKALKYFRKAVECEPDNAVNHCNVAGVLSEMGNYADSNEVLELILQKVEPSLTECYFYMANNYANMGQFEEAEKALIVYLEEDVDGNFLEEAEDMMELLYYELERPIKLNRIKARQGAVEQDQARLLLEEGEFAQAAKLLEQISGEAPALLSVRNNLALSYYYMGMFDRAKEIILQVLQDDPGNLHALCNLAIIYENEGGGSQLEALLKRLTIIVPFQQDQVFKLGTTMGMMGHHEQAYAHFQRLLKDGGNRGDAFLYHYAAVAASNTGRYAQAQRLWEQVNKLDPESETPRFYLARLKELCSKNQPMEKISYHYHMPFDEQLRLWKKCGSDNVPEEMKQDPLVRASLFWALRHGDDAMKSQVIQALTMVGDEEVREALGSVLADLSQVPALREQARMALKNMEDMRTPFTGSESINFKE